MKHKRPMTAVFILILLMTIGCYLKSANLPRTGFSDPLPVSFNKMDLRPDPGAMVNIRKSTEIVTSPEASLTTDSLFSHILGDTLIAMQVFDEKSDNPYIRYGYEFSGHCYNCTMVDFLITTDKIVFVHSCTPEKNKSYSYVLTENYPDSFLIRTENGLELFFERTDTAPVLKARIKGYIGKDAQGYPEFGEYYTTSASLHKFAVCDCGDFDG